VSLVLNDLVSLSRLMGEPIQALRTWAKGRARLATTPIEQASGRKFAARFSRSNIETTMVYTHVLNRPGISVKSAADG
jgi:hypothetical protein